MSCLTASIALVRKGVLLGHCQAHHFTQLNIDRHQFCWTFGRPRPKTGTVSVHHTPHCLPYGCERILLCAPYPLELIHEGGSDGRIGGKTLQTLLEVQYRREDDVEQQ